MKPTNFKQTCKYNKIMTTKDEIDELSEEFLTFHQEGSKVYHIKIREAIAFAYTQCQEDMADKKYTEEDLHNLLRARRQLYSHTDENVLKVFINSLNKQD